MPGALKSLAAVLPRLNTTTIYDPSGRIIGGYNTNR